MFRRHFMRTLTASGSALAAIQGSQAHPRETVTLRVKGFTCITCAVGLETMLRQEKGIFQAHASYPKANVVVEFNPSVITTASLKGYISDMGFGAEEELGQ